MLIWFIDRKAGARSSYFKQYTTWFAKIYRSEIISIQYRRRVKHTFHDSYPGFCLALPVWCFKGNMVNCSGSCKSFQTIRGTKDIYIITRGGRSSKAKAVSLFGN